MGYCCCCGLILSLRKSGRFDAVCKGAGLGRLEAGGVAYGCEKPGGDLTAAGFAISTGTGTGGVEEDPTAVAPTAAPRRRCGLLM